MMGSPKDDADRNDDEAQHQVTLSRGFYLLETEVTQEMSVNVKRTEPAWLQTEVSAPKDAAGLTRIFTIKIKVPATAPTGNYIFQDGGIAAFIELETSDKMTPFLNIPVQLSIGK